MFEVDPFLRSPYSPFSLALFFPLTHVHSPVEGEYFHISFSKPSYELSSSASSPSSLSSLPLLSLSLSSSLSSLSSSSLSSSSLSSSSLSSSSLSPLPFPLLFSLPP